MFTQRHFTQSITFLFFYWISFVSSIELVQLHDSSEISVAKKLVKFLEDKLIQLPHNNLKIIDEGIEASINSNNEFAKDDSPELSSFDVKKEDLNKVLVKRVVPHGLHQTFEHDFGPYTDYRPIMRIHKKGKTGNKDNKLTNNKLQFLYFIKSNKLNHATSDKLQASNNHKKIEHRLPNKNKKREKVESRDKYIKSMLKHLGFNGSPRDPQRIETEARKLGSPRSGEINNPLAPGGSFMFSKDEPTTKQAKWLPKYPFWNYWTYKKTIYQDVCPGNQIALGNICVWVPPH